MDKAGGANTGGKKENANPTDPLSRTERHGKDLDSRAHRGSRVASADKSDKLPTIDVLPSKSAGQSESMVEAGSQNPKPSADSLQSNKARRGSPPDTTLLSDRHLLAARKTTTDQALQGVGSHF